MKIEIYLDEYFLHSKPKKLRLSPTYPCGIKIEIIDGDSSCSVQVNQGELHDAIEKLIL